MGAADACAIMQDCPTSARRVRSGYVGARSVVMGGRIVYSEPDREGSRRAEAFRVWCRTHKIPVLKDGRVEWVRGSEARPFDHRSVIYALQATTTGPIKIGTSTDFENRFRSLCNMSPWPLEVIALFEGDRERERWLHRRFARYRKHGEWFEPAPIILRWAQRMGVIR